MPTAVPLKAQTPDNQLVEKYKHMTSRETVCIIGLGLIGGSMAIDLKKTGFAKKLIGVDANADHVTTALQQGIIDEGLALEEAVAKSDIVVLCTPVDVIMQLLPAILDMMQGSDKVITDTGSTKAEIISCVRNHPNRKAYVAAHPMAGIEKSGPDAALSGLFDNHYLIICDKEDSDAEAVARTNKLFQVLNMRITYMDAAAHDASAAYVSHLSHLASFALSLCVQESEKDQGNICRLAGGGFTSAVRLAKSSAEMWAPIFSQNNQHILAVLQSYINKLELFKDHLIEMDDHKMIELIRESNKIETVIK